MYNPNIPGTPGTMLEASPTPSLDLPPTLASMFFGMPAQNPMMQTSTPPAATAGLAYTQPIPSYQQGGLIGPDGMPVPMGAPPGGTPATPSPTLSSQELMTQVNQFAMQHPQQLAQIRAVIEEGLMSGELTQQELNTIVQLATVAAQNPEMYPYVRNFAIQQGIAAEQDLPAQYDQGLVFVLLLAARAAQTAVGGQNMMQQGSPALAGGTPIPSMAKGGPVPGASRSDPIMIEAHTGEYVIPKHVVDMKGKEFFDNLVAKYEGNK